MPNMIAVTGKGGTGKTVIAALIIKYLKEHSSGPILALDADPDSNLGTVLGIPVETTIGDLREETLKEIKKMPAGMSKSNYIEAGLHQIIVETDKLDMITIGRSEGPGCYCYINSLLRKFADDLHGSYEWVVMDNEAGLEHLSRRTASRIQNLIVVINSNPLSVDCAYRIEKLVSDLENEIDNKYLLINDVGKNRLESLKKRTKGLDMEYLGCIPHDDDLENSVFDGKPLLEFDSGPAVMQIEKIMKKLGA